MASKKTIKSRFLYTIAAAAVLIILSLYACITSFYSKNAVIDEPSLKGRLKLNTLWLKELHLSGDLFHQPVHLKKYPIIGWYVNGIPANNQLVEQYISRVNDIKTIDFLDSHNKDVAMYGFREPHVAIHLTYPGDTIQDILIGDQAPTSNLRYIRMSDTDKVLLADYSSSHDLFTHVGMLRDLNYSMMYKDVVTSLSLQVHQDQPYKLTRIRGQWFVDQPVKMVADHEYIDYLLDKLCGQNADNEINPQFWKLPHFKQLYGTVGLIDSFGRQSTVQFSEPIKFSEFAYAHSTLRPNVFLVHKTVLDAMKVDLNKIKSKLLVDISEQDAHTIELWKNNVKQVKFIKKNYDHWEVSSLTKTMSMDKDDFIDKIFKQPLSGYTNKPIQGNRSVFGLEKPVYTLKVYADREAVVLTFGRQLDKENYYLAKSGDPFVNAVDSAFVQYLKTLLGDL